ncbi:Mrp/NBP35 family ATP-binding protein [Candidatus Ichthyocystis hellenicum]|uniref:Mrp/NBP35 family ATP-binding protein n=1 Tax=Candidatus Ichthyocystis hellenicum TaxID=1561003 RepID=UPI001111953C|nr:Mrp/NBP35 family ATP-binding protein [Candidatus Ichthyocystis hellenicum]
MSEVIMYVNSHEVCNVLSKLYDPYQGELLVESGQLTVEDNSVRVLLPYPAQGYHSVLSEQIRVLLADNFPNKSFDISVSSGFSAHENARGMDSMPHVKNTLVVASGKGGVGKSTVALAIAKSYVEDGASVGLLDADIYGPSLPQLIDNWDDKPDLDENDMMLPIQVDGLSVMSIGHLVRPESAVAWRGPMATQALNQLLTKTCWGSLDILVIDMPPGTGDIYLTLSQKVPVTASVIVTTPHPLSFYDARRSLHLFQRVDIPVLGIIENMSFFSCSNCSHRHFLFGQGAGDRLANEARIDLLGQLPLSIGSGCDSDFKVKISDIARKLAVSLSRLKSKSSRRVKIEIKPIAKGNGKDNGS